MIITKTAFTHSVAQVMKQMYTDNATTNLGRLRLHMAVSK